MEVFCLFSKTQNHLRREPDCHGTRGTGHTYLWSLRRPHSLNHLENIHPKHQQRRKGIMSPKSFRAVERRLHVDWVCPMPSPLWWTRKWNVVTGGCSQVLWPPSSSLPWLWPSQHPLEMERAQFLAWVCRGMMVVGMVRLDVARRKGIVIFKPRLRSWEEQGEWRSQCTGWY